MLTRPVACQKAPTGRGTRSTLGMFQINRPPRRLHARTSPFVLFAFFHTLHFSHFSLLTLHSSHTLHTLPPPSSSPPSFSLVFAPFRRFVVSAKPEEHKRVALVCSLCLQLVSRIASFFRTLAPRLAQPHKPCHLSSSHGYAPLLTCQPVFCLPLHLERSPLILVPFEQPRGSRKHTSR